MPKNGGKRLTHFFNKRRSQNLPSLWTYFYICQHIGNFNFHCLIVLFNANEDLALLPKYQHIYFVKFMFMLIEVLELNSHNSCLRNSLCLLGHVNSFLNWPPIHFYRVKSYWCKYQHLKNIDSAMEFKPWYSHLPCKFSQSF